MSPEGNVLRIAENYKKSIKYLIASGLQNNDWIFREGCKKAPRITFAPGKEHRPFDKLRVCEVERLEMIHDFCKSFNTRHFE